MLAPQNEVTEGGVPVADDTDPVVPDPRLEPWRTEEPPDLSRLRSSTLRRPPTKREAHENIPLELREVKDGDRKNRTHHSSTAHTCTTQDDADTIRGHRVALGQQSPVEGSLDTVSDSRSRTSADKTTKPKKTVEYQAMREGPGVDVTNIIDPSPRIKASGNLRRKQDRTPNRDVDDN